MCPVCGEQLGGREEPVCPECGALLPAATPPQKHSAPAADPEATPPPLSGEWTARLQALVEGVETSRRLATLVFVDLVGYSRLTRELSITQHDELMDWFYGVCRRCIQANGGFVVRFQGDAVLGCFGAPFAFGRDAESAAWAVHFIREAVLHQGEFCGYPLSVRAAMQTGFVTVRNVSVQNQQQLSISGRVVEEVSRLDKYAAQGQILAGTTLAPMLEDAFDLRAHDGSGPGLLEVRAPRTGLVSHGRGALLGRGEALERLAALYEETAAHGQRRTVAVLGPKGTGKLRLLEVAAATGRWSKVVLIPTPPHACQTPLLAARLMAGVPSWADQETTAAALQARLAEDGVLVVQDLDRADGASCAVLREAVRLAWARSKPGHLLVVTGESLPRQAPAVQERILLESLRPVDAQAALLERLADAPVMEAMIRRLLEQAKGNPRRLELLADSLLLPPPGSLADSMEPMDLNLGLPTTLRPALLEQLQADADKLSPAKRALLQIHAVVGQGTREQDLATRLLRAKGHDPPPAVPSFRPTQVPDDPLILHVLAMQLTQDQRELLLRGRPSSGSRG